MNTRRPLIFSCTVGALLTLSSCGRDIADAPPEPTHRPFTVLASNHVRAIEWSFLQHGEQFSVAEQGSLRLRLRQCTFDVEPNTRLLATPLDAFSVVLGEGIAHVACESAPTPAPLRVITCSGALEVAQGTTRVGVQPGLVTSVAPSHALDFLPGETNNPDLRIRVEADTPTSFGARGVVSATTTPESSIPPDFTSRERYAREFEHAIVLVEDALTSVTVAFREGQELSARHASATRQGNHEGRARTSALLAENARKQHRIRELLRLRYSRLLACDIVREQRGLDIPRLSAAYAPRVENELGIR